LLKSRIGAQRLVRRVDGEVVARGGTGRTDVFESLQRRRGVAQREVHLQKIERDILIERPRAKISVAARSKFRTGIFQQNRPDLDRPGATLSDQ